jgi:hypothetical protein
MTTTLFRLSFTTFESTKDDPSNEKTANCNASTDETSFKRMRLNPCSSIFCLAFRSVDDTVDSPGQCCRFTTLEFGEFSFLGRRDRSGSGSESRSGNRSWLFFGFFLRLWFRLRFRLFLGLFLGLLC